MATQNKFKGVLKWNLYMAKQTSYSMFVCGLCKWHQCFNTMQKCKILHVCAVQTIET